MMIRELNEMKRMAGASALALELQTKKNQQLQHEITLMRESIDTLRSQRSTAEAQIARLLDLLEQTQAQLDATQAELNRALAVVNAARKLSETLRGIYGDPEYFMPELEKLKPLDDLLVAYDAAQVKK